MSYRARALDSDTFPLKLLLRLPFYWLWLTKEIVKSGLNTTKIIWSNNYSPQLIKIKASQKNSTGIANYANAITLTPGTVTIEVEKNDLLVHALSKELSKDLHSDDEDTAYDPQNIKKRGQGPKINVKKTIEIDGSIKNSVMNYLGNALPMHYELNTIRDAINSRYNDAFKWSELPYFRTRSFQKRESPETIGKSGITLAWKDLKLDLPKLFT